MTVWTSDHDKRTVVELCRVPAEMAEATWDGVEFVLFAHVDGKLKVSPASQFLDTFSKVGEHIQLDSQSGVLKSLFNYAVGNGGNRMDVIIDAVKLIHKQDERIKELESRVASANVDQLWPIHNKLADATLALKLLIGGEAPAVEPAKVVEAPRQTPAIREALLQGIQWHETQLNELRLRPGHESEIKRRMHEGQLKAMREALVIEVKS